MQDLRKGIQHACSIQIISLITTCLMSLVLPKMLDVEEFSYWQIFVFYIGYVGFFHFGFNDGLYLHYGGWNYKNLNHACIAIQILFLFILEIIIVLILIAFSMAYIQNVNKLHCAVFASFYLILFNIYTAFNFILQITKRIKDYAKSEAVGKYFILVFLAVSYGLEIRIYEYFCFAYLFGQMISMVCAMRFCKEIFIFEKSLIRDAYHEFIYHIWIGIKLMLSNIASMLILGIGRFFVETYWGIITFGILSFSLSLTYFFLMFIGQISLVLFPFLRSADRERLEEIYFCLKSILNLFFLGIFILYFPAKSILLKWLPQYTESVLYFGILMPICFFDGKMQLIYNTYLKVLRKEKAMLYINLGSVLLSSCLYLICMFYIKNISFILLAMVFSIFFRSVVAECYLNKMIAQRRCSVELLEYILIGLFFLCVISFEEINGFYIYTIFYSMYFIYKRKPVYKKYREILNFYR